MPSQETVVPARVASSSGLSSQARERIVPPCDDPIPIEKTCFSISRKVCYDSFCRTKMRIPPTKVPSPSPALLSLAKTTHDVHSNCGRLVAAGLPGINSGPFSRLHCHQLVVAANSRNVERSAARQVIAHRRLFMVSILGLSSSRLER